MATTLSNNEYIRSYETARPPRRVVARNFNETRFLERRPLGPVVDGVYVWNNWLTKVSDFFNKITLGCLCQPEFQTMQSTEAEFAVDMELYEEHLLEAGGEEDVEELEDNHPKVSKPGEAGATCGEVVSGTVENRLNTTEDTVVDNAPCQDEAAMSAADKKRARGNRRRVRRKALHRLVDYGKTEFPYTRVLKGKVLQAQREVVGRTLRRYAKEEMKLHPAQIVMWVGKATEMVLMPTRFEIDDLASRVTVDGAERLGASALFTEPGC